MAESGENLPPPETYYDPQTQRLVIGRAALQAETSSQEMGDYDFDTPPVGDTPAAYQSLPELLTGKEFPYKPSELSASTKRMRLEPAEIEQLSMWAYRHIQQAGGVTLHGGHFYRLHLLGLSPERRVIFGKIDMRSLRETVQTDKNRHQADVSDWTKQDWRKYAQRVHKLIPNGPRPPTGIEYTRLAPKLGGPTRHTIWRRFGGIGGLNELIGYPDVSNWDEDDMVDWGVRVLQANPDQPAILNQVALRILSKRGAGPTYERIRNTCGSYPAFKERVYEQLREQQELEHVRIIRRLERFDEIMSIPDRPSNGEELAPETMTESEKLGFAAKYDLAMKLLGTGDHMQAWRAARLDVADFTARIRYLRPGIRKGDMELEASLQEIMDDIWPPDRELDALKVAQEEFDANKDHKKTDTADSDTNASKVASEASISEVKQTIAEPVHEIATQGLKQLLAIRRELASVRELYAYLLEGSQGGEEPAEHMTRALDILSEEVIAKLEAGIAASKEVERRL